MKNFIKIATLLIGFSLLFSTGCEKLNDEELLTDHIWKFKEITTNSTDQNVISIVAFVNALMTNSTMEFKKNGTFTLSMLNQSESGTWELSDDGKTLYTTDSNGDTDEMTVVKLTKDDLILQGEEVDNTYGTYSVTMHWTK